MLEQTDAYIQYILIIIVKIMSQQDRNRFLNCVFHTQIGCALVANLMMGCYGLICPASSFLIPQLEDKDSGFGINQDQVSWLGKNFFLHNVQSRDTFYFFKFFNFILQLPLKRYRKFT